MSTKISDNRSEQLAALGDEFRQLATVTVMFHQTIADRLGMHVTDQRCLDILTRTGPITAGELAQRTGLTTGAITGVIDRLEKAGFVRRAKDRADRRRVVIEPVVERIEREIAPLFKSIASLMSDLCDHYSAQELDVIRGFIARLHQGANEQIRKLRGDGQPEQKAATEKRKRDSRTSRNPPRS
jgi:DNA-binding MarR family transcriptional regulator